MGKQRDGLFQAGEDFVVGGLGAFDEALGVGDLGTDLVLALLEQIDRPAPAMYASSSF